jgi:hypothetical protein
MRPLAVFNECVSSSKSSVLQATLGEVFTLRDVKEFSFDSVATATRKHV